ncbi:MAG: isoprenylcysteine carboxylmethyltransferase family protein [Leuconostoc sp.]|uniref:methyltransferase family protein n=1 Tax=uncultured Streptococcus sp. TaxID=83427 RepID=UPI0019B85831|nr:isoprenylcysteine carboxylmethyltransferase family protein [uncultured Streptococcus sp.]MBC9702738.1 isoprenylcysteine carboxylmethyltransferase family protein [Leuconostoc sp.]
MTFTLCLSALLKFLLGVVLVAALLFIPAGTLNYPNAILLMVILFVPMFLARLVLMVKNPDLLRRRLKVKEEQGEQRKIIAATGFMFVVGFILAGLDFRLDWLPLPQIISKVSALLFLLAYALYAEVLRENTYLSRTVMVEEEQKVINTGLYGLVRHPMYSATIILFLTMPLVLGSLIAFLVFLPYPIMIIKRLKNEEQVLSKELTGYTEYQKKVRYRLIPYIW